MKTLAFAALAPFVLASLAHAEGQATFYGWANFGGADVTVSDPAPNLQVSGNNPQSVLVRSGRWEICSRPEFRGRCTILEIGEYPKIAEQFGAIGSAREESAIPEDEKLRRRYVQRSERRWER